MQGCWYFQFVPQTTCGWHSAYCCTDNLSTKVLLRQMYKMFYFALNSTIIRPVVLHLKLNTYTFSSLSTSPIHKHLYCLYLTLNADSDLSSAHTHACHYMYQESWYPLHQPSLSFLSGSHSDKRLRLSHSCLSEFKIFPFSCQSSLAHSSPALKITWPYHLSTELLLTIN